MISLKRPCGANGLGPGGSDVVGPASLPFELAMVQDVHCVHLDFAWPRVESERAFLRVLAPIGVVVKWPLGDLFFEGFM